MRPDEDSFTEFVRGRWAVLYRSAYLLTGDRHEAEDLLQSTLADVYLAWGRVAEWGSPEAYVRRALVNRATRTWRRRGRVVLSERLPDAGHDGGLAALLTDLGERAVLWDAVRALPPRMRATLVLRYYEQLSEAETAATLGCSTGSVKSQTHHALKRLRTALGNRHHDLAEELR